MMLARRCLRILVTAVLLISVAVIPASAAAVEAAPTTSTILVDGTEQKFEAYRINGNNYFRLRDVAYALRGTAKQFEAAYDPLNNRVVLTSNAAYTPIGGEMAISGLTGAVAAEPSSNEIYLDGVKVSLKAYVIRETNYVKLRDIAAAIDFGVRFIAETDTIEIDTSAGYTPDVPIITFPSDMDVTFIGDSIGIGITKELKKYFPRISVDAKVSRQFSEARSIVRRLIQESRLAQTVVIELGSNGTIRESHMRELIELIGSDRKIVFVNIQVPRSWCEGNNKTISKVCLDYVNTIIADWYGASIKNSSYFYTDGVHLRSAGVAALSKLIADAIVNIQ
ncbi:MAG: hypothetical protein GX936_08960 [Clostridiales bacterium]|jgi:hypothetical protein|nr:hypothetical protein [Clostridiales bacterium]